MARLWRPARPLCDMGHVSRDLGAMQMTRGHVGSLDHSSHRVSPESGPRHPINLCTADNLRSVINSLGTFFWNKHVYYCLLCPLAGHQHISHKYVNIRPPAPTPANIRLGPSESRSQSLTESGASTLGSGVTTGPRVTEPGHTFPELKSFRFRHKTDKTQHTLGQTTTAVHIKSHREIVFCTLVT